MALIQVQYKRTNLESSHSLQNCLQVYVYDLNVDKYRPICVQAVVSKKTKKLSRIDFNPKLPVIICGDNK